MSTQARISVVTPTFRRPQEVVGLLKNLSQQTHLPYELVLVDGAPPEETETERIVAAVIAGALPFRCNYIRHGGGTAIQRNVGIDHATGDFIAFFDDDMRFEPDYLVKILAVFADDHDHQVGGIAGYITNQHLNPHTSLRWRWYRRLRLFTTYEPGRFDFETGYPINRYLQPPHDSIREIDFMGSNCGVWRREVFDNGLRFSRFFTDYGLIEDAHLALRVSRSWKLLECGTAHCVHDHSPLGRIDAHRFAWKTAVNYRYLFVDIVPHRTLRQELRFWRVQFFDLFRFFVHAVRFGGKDAWMSVLGKAKGIGAAWRVQSGLN